MDFHKGILKNRVRAVSKKQACPTLIHDFISLPCPNAKCHSSHGMLTTVDHVHLENDDEDDQNRRYEGILND